jgi:hypothetical protein
MKEMTTTGFICLQNDLELEYRIATITYTEREDESFSYVFTPNYPVIDLLAPPVFQGIPGLDLSLRKPEYRRDGAVPVFISERAPNRNREDLVDLLGKVGMKYLNQLEWLMRTDLRYSGDGLYVRRPGNGEEKRCVSFKESVVPERARVLCRRLLTVICQGDDVTANGYSIDDANRKEFHSLLISLYRNEVNSLRSKRIEGIRSSAAKGKYRGRQRIRVDEPKALEIFGRFRKGTISEAEALERLAFSRSTFYRRLKDFESKL